MDKIKGSYDCCTNIAQGSNNKVILIKYYGASIAFIIIFGIWAQCTAMTISDGVTLFEQENYEKAIIVFKEQLKAKPDNPEANYYLGRCLLATNRADIAMNYLSKADDLGTNIPEYKFWLGVGYWANMEFDKERQSYIDVLKISPNHLQANLYLGHSYMDKNMWMAALDQYNVVLAINPDVPEAIYNTALIYKKINNKEAEIKAWLSYLSRYQYGKTSYYGVERLNILGDFTYREILIGNKKIVMPAIRFDQNGTMDVNDGRKALQIIGETLVKENTLYLHVVAFVNNSSDEAKSRAMAIKNSILKNNPKIDQSRIKTSWFDVPEKVETKRGIYSIDESILFITMQERESSK